MSFWAAIVKRAGQPGGLPERIRAADAEGAADLLERADDAARRALAGSLREFAAQGGLGRGWWAGPPHDPQAPALRVAGAACFDDAVEVAHWLTSPDLWLFDGYEDDARRIARVVRGRSPQWRAELVRRLADEQGWRDEADGGRAHRLSAWFPAARLVEETGLEPPGDPAFVLGWLHAVAGSGGGVTDERLTRHLAGSLLRSRGLAAQLRGTGDLVPAGAAAVARRASDGVLERGTLLEGCAGAFFDGETRPFTDLYAALRPSPEEIPVRDLARLVPTAPGTVVQLAVSELRRADDAGLLSDELFAEATETLMFRPEKTIVRAALTWAQAGTRGSRERTGAALRAFAAAFGSAHRDIAERAVDAASRMAGHSGEDGHAAVRAAADALPSDLRDRLAPVFRLDDRPALAPAALPAPPAEEVEPVPVVESPEELAELAVTARDPLMVERLLAGLVTLVHRDREAVRAVVEPVLRASRPFLFDVESAAHGFGGMNDDPHLLTMRAVLAAVAPEAGRRLRGLVQFYPFRDWDPAPDVLVVTRLREIVRELETGDVPVLLATPTVTSGHIDPMTLVERMERLEAACAEHLDADFQQALLRLPRTIPPAAVARAGTLTSAAGRELAAWLRRGGLADPVIGHRVVRLPSYEGSATTVTRIFPAVRPREEDLPDLVRRMCVLDPAGAVNLASQRMDWWPLLMPSHREVITAWILPRLPPLITSRRADLAPLYRLACGQGPVGEVTAAALAHGLGCEDDGARGIAVDALLVHAARGDLNGDDFGGFLSVLVAAGMVRLGRAVTALADALATGAHIQVWDAAARMLTELLPQARERPRTGMTDLLVVAATAASLTGARLRIPRLAAVAQRTGGSAFVRQARRLHELITPKKETS
ncbi:DUF6493 family protein [Microbispora hainanensis]|uniref:DUF7824 domain-containing protein n=1 Tax=Microbispora hainanensis TaxID=568844 RepID=A0A544Z015_9ACTN|nr:DUF6493 family protein [Microbispora hainanensis]TQS22315.1 hypothetical protein FLX08_07915 [Microbispora hainanensis]